MRGLGAFQMAQMKHRDARVFALCRHLRSAIDILEQIETEPYQLPESSAPEPAAVPAPLPPPTLPPAKLTYTMKEAAAAIGICRTTLWRAVSDGKLAAIKLGNRTLIPAEELRAWLASMPTARRRPQP